MWWSSVVQQCGCKVLTLFSQLHIFILKDDDCNPAAIIKITMWKLIAKSEKQRENEKTNKEKFLSFNCFSLIFMTFNGGIDSNHISHFSSSVICRTFIIKTMVAFWLFKTWEKGKDFYCYLLSLLPWTRVPENLSVSIPTIIQRQSKLGLWKIKLSN